MLIFVFRLQDSWNLKDFLLIFKILDSILPNFKKNIKIFLRFFKIWQRMQKLLVLGNYKIKREKKLKSHQSQKINKKAQHKRFNLILSVCLSTNAFKNQLCSWSKALSSQIVLSKKCSKMTLFGNFLKFGLLCNFMEHCSLFEADWN